MECQSCNLSSPLEQFFTEIKKGKWVCPACNHNRNNKDGLFTVIWVLSFLVIGHTMVAMDLDFTYQYFLLGAAWWTIFVYSSIAIHEFGHYFICRLLGGICPLVKVGEGRVFYQFKTSSSLWQFSAKPTLGLAYAVFPESKGEVWREVFMLLGGVIMNAILAVISILFFLYGSHISIVREWQPLLVILVVVNALLIFGSLFTSLQKKGLESDGYAIYRLLRHGRNTDFYKNQKVAYQSTISQALLARGEFQELSELILENDDYKKSVLSLITLSACYSHTYRISDFLQTATDAIELLQSKTDSLPDGIVEEAVSALAMNNLAFALYSTRSSDKEKILSLAKKAYDLLPWEHSVKGTYGMSLVYSDFDVANGVAILESLISKPAQVSDEIISINYYCLAEGYLKQGEFIKAEEANKNALDLNPDVDKYFQLKH